MNNLIKPKYWRKNSSLKSVVIKSKQWFDKVNGNSYGSSQVTINHGLKNEFSFNIPFCYGYGDYQKQKAFEMLIKAGILDKEYQLNNWKNNSFSVDFMKQENCLKREVMAWGKE